MSSTFNFFIKIIKNNMNGKNKFLKEINASYLLLLKMRYIIEIKNVIKKIINCKKSIFFIEILNPLIKRTFKNKINMHISFHNENVKTISLLKYRSNKDFERKWNGIQNIKKPMIFLFSKKNESDAMIGNSRILICNIYLIF